eukprot:GFYU01043748.1.p1 GENE.GFYU01043748.1~~GFYU01043748.1.p1  ORF type:complete len:159 (-),score=30.95 GFYU01043748.1:202-624(-)
MEYATQDEDAELTTYGDDSVFWKPQRLMHVPPPARHLDNGGDSQSSFSINMSPYTQVLDLTRLHELVPISSHDQLKEINFYNHQERSLTLANAIDFPDDKEMGTVNQPRPYKAQVFCSYMRNRQDIPCTLHFCWEFPPAS